MTRQRSSLKAYALTRIGLIVPMVLILLTLVFVLMRVAPGDPIEAALAGRVPHSQIVAIKHRLGFDKPLYVQYGHYLYNVARADFGRTITDNRPVRNILAVNGAATLELTMAAGLVAIVVGVGLGLLTGHLRDTPFDVGGRVFGIVIYATPVFFLGFLAQLVFGQVLGWLPTSGQAGAVTQAFLPTPTHIYVLDAIIAGDGSALLDVLKHLVMPAMTLGLVIGGVFIRLVRVNVIRAMQDDYVEAARARGVRERRVVVRHGFKNALVPVVTIVGLQMALLLSGAVLTETTFDWPGIGKQLIDYLNARDYAAVQGIVTVFALVVVIVSIVIDFVNAFIDPRIRY